ncbi:hypothetical protein [Nannocystis sp. SCPEA4]|uniref:hypothetical protein n=1 Tax=Nannocystis sp. SCPEA4 TaxID=2996787 RepID=UPI00226F6070|nr:hypothetical protein [Nannocystis sp. SCPEA4]MCY1057390.1 hypothetical protein [Nannocystis sp. SCPEA4]
MHITTRIELGILLSALLACSFKAELSASDTYTAGDPGTGDSESSSPGTDGATTTSAGPGGDSHWSGTATMHPVPEGETTGTTVAEPGNSTDTTWAGTTLETSGPGDPSDTWAGTTLEPDPGTDTHVTTTPYTTGEPAPCEGEAVPIEAEVLSYVESQIDPAPGLDPNMLYIRFSDQTFTCADPHDRLACGHHWELSLRLPSGFQTPGLYALDFADMTPHGFGLQTGTDIGSDDCDGGGSAAKGLIQVIAIDEDKVVGRLCHVTWSGLDNDFELDGSFIAPRCPQ